MCFETLFRLFLHTVLLDVFVDHNMSFELPDEGFNGAFHRQWCIGCENSIFYVMQPLIEVQIGMLILDANYRIALDFGLW